MHINRIELYPHKFPKVDNYPFNLELFQKTTSLTFDRNVTFFAGENGSGKSTLLRAICHRCDIHIWEDTQRSRASFNPYEEDLYKYLHVDWNDGTVPGSFFASQIFRDFTRFLDEWAKNDPGILEYFGGQSLVTQSHGQSLISFFETRYRIKGLYLLDEPETALSPVNQIKLMGIIKTMTRDGRAQFIISSHSPILLAYPDAVIFSFDSLPVKPIRYEETAYYKIYRDFLNNRDRYLREL